MTKVLYWNKISIISCLDKPVNVVKRLLMIKIAKTAKQTHEQVKNLKAWYAKRKEKAVYNFGTREDPNWPDSVLSLPTNTDPLVMAAAITCSGAISEMREAALRATQEGADTNGVEAETEGAKQMLMKVWNLPEQQATRLAAKSFWRAELAKWSEAKTETELLRYMVEKGVKMSTIKLCQIARAHNQARRRVQMLLKEDDLPRARGGNRTDHFPFFVYGSHMKK